MAKKKKRLEKKVLIGEKRVSVYGFSAYEIQEKIEALRKAEERRKCPTFSTVADEWDDMHSKEVEFYTANCYVTPLKDAKAEFGEMLITDITYDDVKTYIKEYASLGYKKQTVKLRRSVIKQIYDYAIVKGYVQTNPAKGVKIPKNVKNGVRELPEESDIEKEKASVNEPFGLFPFLIMYTGARREEALAIQIKNIDLNKNIIRINQVVIFEIGETIVRKYTKTDAGMRDVPILLPLRKELEKIVKNANSESFLFSGKNGNAMTKSEYDKAMRAYKIKSNVNCTAHQLRHEFATLCYDAELEAKDAQQIMGHSKESVTRDIYTHIREKRKKDAVKKLNNFIEYGNAYGPKSEDAATASDI